MSVNYQNCATTVAIAAAPANYTSTVTLTPSATTVAAGQSVTLTWHYSISTAPPGTGIPIPNAAVAKAKILVGGAASSTITAGPSAAFPPAIVAPGAQFQIPDFTAKFTPTVPGTYTFTPGDNEEDISSVSAVITCTASGASSAATITVTAATGGGSPSSSAPSSPATSSSSSGVLPHTGFDGVELFGAAVAAAVLGGAGLLATRRRGHRS
jgi:LPXTG-motif cell wall-anchored protein